MKKYSEEVDRVEKSDFMNNPKTKTQVIYLIFYQTYLMNKEKVDSVIKALDGDFCETDPKYNWCEQCGQEKTPVMLGNVLEKMRLQQIEGDINTEVHRHQARECMWRWGVAGFTKSLQTIAKEESEEGNALFEFINDLNLK